MFTGATKIVKPEGQEADEFEQTVAQELFNLEVGGQLPHSTPSAVNTLVMMRTARLTCNTSTRHFPYKMSCISEVELTIHDIHDTHFSCP